MNEAMAQMQALPTVLAPIVRIRKEELSLKLPQHARRRHAARASARSCSKAWRRTAACTCRSATRRSTRPRSTRWRGLSYADLAFEILSLYIDDIPAADLRALCRKTYTAERLRHATRSRRCKPLGRRPVRSQALSNGPTLAFKDMAMQLLGSLFEYELARRGEHAQHPGRHLGRHRQRGRIRDARQARRPASSCSRRTAA